MENLDKYAEQFDSSYPKYADARYSEVLALVARYDSNAASKVLASESFKQALEMILPVISIKNYKSQIPFPEDIFAVVETVLSVRKVTIDASDRFNGLKPLFNKLVTIQGFQLPTVSAVFHFCHPEHFPIVDKNVQAACKALIDRSPELAGYKYPQLPASGTSAANKLKKYRQFIQVIDKVQDLHLEKQKINDYRSMDKALMVLGALELKTTADTISKTI
ncbi:hypothetical protein NYP20_11390 [Pseudomonas sp. N3-W]|uniref:hypothetical protein n=1 Tax=Pseudomonas sp. N3-W TaxID=2975049 RepID=UPI00217D1CB6|nr:hypothetical protein [Pseudomonas sp. N3-W]UWF51526.1 hypothetical protein NYP20_11390 [Pseudomonas sp. N3-W]